MVYWATIFREENMDGFGDALTRVAGQELDAIVAERVFGCQWREEAATPSVSFLYSPPPHGKQAIALRGSDGVLRPIAHLGRCSTSMSNAWGVVEEMSRRGWNADIHACGDGYVCAFNNLSHSARVAVDPREGGAPLAICLAALKALESPSPRPAKQLCRLCRLCLEGECVLCRAPE